MSFGMDIGGVRRTRAYTGENTAGFAKSAATVEGETQPKVVNVKSTLAADGTYTLTLSLDGDAATATGVEPGDLSQRIASLLTGLRKAIREADVVKGRQSDSSPFGLGTPRSNREALRFVK